MMPSNRSEAKNSYFNKNQWKTPIFPKNGQKHAVGQKAPKKRPLQGPVGPFLGVICSHAIYTGVRKEKYENKGNEGKWVKCEKIRIPNMLSC